MGSRPPRPLSPQLLGSPGEGPEPRLSALRFLKGYPLAMRIARLWRWLQGPEPSLEQIAEAEEVRREHEAEREKIVDQYYEEGFPSHEVVKAELWGSLW